VKFSEGRTLKQLVKQFCSYYWFFLYPMFTSLENGNSRSKAYVLSKICKV